jgi:hypothetical protein
LHCDTPIGKAAGYEDRCLVRHQKGRAEPTGFGLYLAVIIPFAFRSGQRRKFMEQQAMSDFVSNVGSLPLAIMRVVVDDYAYAAKIGGDG